MTLRLLPTFILFFFSTSFTTYGQKIIKGKILNRTTLEPIAYANIGIKNSNVGTISNLDGSFLLLIPQKLINDTLTFSSLGFGKKIIPAKSLTLAKNITVYLNEKIVSLKAVVVNSKKEKTETFEPGNPIFKGGVLEADTTYAGRSIALLIENKEPNFQKKLNFPAYLEKARLRIFRNNLKVCKFRIRLNAVDSLTGQPGEDILQESIVMESSMKNGWLEFDLSHLNYEISKSFFVTFEQILDLGDRTVIANEYREFIAKHPDNLKIDTIEIDGKKEIIKKFTGSGIDLAGTFIGIATSKSAAEQYACHIRETSFGEWKKVRGIVAATVTVSSQVSQPVNENNDPECKNRVAECKAEKLCKDFMDDNGLNGMQICVSKKNKVIWNASLGYADIVNKIPVTDSTKFRINSISKSMTSIALIKLIAENKLNLDSPIQKYVSSFPIKPYPITTRQLAGHLAGFRDYNENDLTDHIRTEHFENATQALKIFKDDTLLFKPNDKFYYSTFGWNLIGAIIEGISGESYLSYMSKNIWQPLKLSNTCGDNTKDKITNKSKFYDATGEENELGDLSYKYSGGGLLSTANDLNKFGNELLHGTYVDTKLKKILFQTQYTTDKKETGHGLGWYLGKDKNGHRMWYHSGDSFTGSSFIIIYPDDDMVITFLANSQAGVVFDIEKIGELFYKN